MQTDRLKAQSVQIERLAAENAELRAEVARLRLAISAASNVARSYVSVDGRLLHDVVVEMGSKFEAAEAEIERLRALLDGYEAMEKSMKQEASG